MKHAASASAGPLLLEPAPAMIAFAWLAYSEVPMEVKIKNAIAALEAYEFVVKRPPLVHDEQADLPPVGMEDF